MLTFGSLFAGIGGFDLGFHQAGMRCAWQVEIDSACRFVLTRRWPDVPRFEDVRGCGADTLACVDIICGGFPCQDLSVAGNRAGLAGERSGLFYEMTRITNALQPAFFIWENVPGLLSSDSGRDFARVLMELERIGYSGCWSTLDAQWFGLAQRRQRVFGVFARRDIGAGVCVEILSLVTRLPWNTEKGGAAETRVASAITRSAGHHGRSSPRGDGSDNLIAQFDGHSANSVSERVGDANTLDGDGRDGVILSFNMHSYAQDASAASVSPTLAADHGVGLAYALSAHHGRNSGEDTFVCAAHGGASDNAGQAGHIIPILEIGKRTNGDGYRDGDGIGNDDDPMYTLQAGAQHGVGSSFGVRRLTPLECERLQGFPDGWTAGQSDSTRYRQLGNAVAVPVAAWIGSRIMEATCPDPQPPS